MILVGPLTAKLQRLKKNSFAKSVSILVSGTAIAHALVFLATPILTRLYTPEDFSILAAYAAIIGIISVVSCLAFDMAIPLPKDDEEAISLLILALSSTFLISSISFGIVYLIPVTKLTSIGMGSLAQYRWMIPIAVLLSGAFSALQYFGIRNKGFLTISKARIFQSSLTISSQVGFGVYGVSPFGLLFGQMLSTGSGATYLGAILLKRRLLVLKRMSTFNNLKHQFLKYKRFPQYTTFESLSNSAGIYFPIIIIAALAIGPEAGFLALATRVMQTPMGLLGRAVAQVYISQAPSEESSGNLSTFTEEVLKSLIRVGVGPLIFIGIVAPPTFSILFGQEWIRAGEIVTWMTPWFVLQFLSSPISTVMHIMHQQKKMLVVTLAGFIIRVGTIILAAMYFRQFFAEFYAISGSIFYLACYFIFSKFAGFDLNRSLLVFWATKYHILMWSILSFLANTLLQTYILV